MVQVYTTNISSLPDPLEYPQIMEKLDDARKEKIMCLRQVESRKQSLGAGLLLRYVLECCQILGTEESMNGKIQTGVHGKPEIEGIYFNLSHSKEMVVCVVSEKLVGCDIEKNGDAPHKVSDRFFTEKEKNYLSGLADKEKDREFYRLWTMKESYIKMTGEGLSIALNQFEVRMDTDIKVIRQGEIQDCFFKEYEIPGYILTVCAKENFFEEKGIDISFCKRYNLRSVLAV